MKIGILCTMINGFGRKGYYNSQEIGLGRALSRRGHTVCIYKGMNREKGSKMECRELEKGLSIRYIPMWHFGVHGYLRTSLLDRNLDAVLCFWDNQIFLPHIERFCKKNGIIMVPYIGAAHSIHSGLHAKIMNALFSMGTLKIYRRKPVIAKTETARMELKKLGVQDVTLAPVGLDFAALKSGFREYDRGLLREKFGYQKEDVIICSVMRMEPEKRPLDLLDIFARVKAKKKCKLLIVGEGILSTEVKNKIVARGLEQDVKIIDRVPYGDIWKIYTISDYFVNLNKIEVFGMAILEAIYYGVSVAASTAPGPNAILKEMDGHRLCQNDQEVEDWLTAEYPEKEALIRSAEKVKEKFGWDSCADTFLSVISKSRRK